jgi:hypothetical protein
MAGRECGKDVGLSRRIHPRHLSVLLAHQKRRDRDRLDKNAGGSRVAM